MTHPAGDDEAVRPAAERVRGVLSLQERRALVEVAAGRAPADLALRGARVLNVFRGAFEAAEVLLAGRAVAAVLPVGAAEERPEPRAVETLDGGTLVPGLVDAHMHLESSLVTPLAYAREVVPRGVTGVVCDPHEVANVAGVAGVRWLLGRARSLPLDVWLAVSSCVPSTRLETAGAALDAEAMAALLEEPEAVALAELMSFPQVVGGDPEQLAKALLAEARGKAVDGHAPGLRGAALQAYAAAGAGSDHECGSLEEGAEKLAAGLALFVREGSVARDAKALAPLVTREWGERVAFCSDDVLPHDLRRDGGVDAAVRIAVANGADPAVALTAASWNAARHYRLPRRGAVAPGYLADLAWLIDPAAVSVRAVWKEGRLVAREGAPRDDWPERAGDAGDDVVRDTVHLSDGFAERLRLPAEGGPVDVVEVRPNALLTRAVRVEPTVRAGEVRVDAERDLAKLACVERHGRNGEAGVALVRGFGLRRGALASSVGHDHHNLMLVGMDDADLVAAARRLEALGGGFVAVADGDVLAELPLPLAGLLTDAPLPEVTDALDALEAAARELGCALPSPFMALSFLGLAVIPELKLTDRGLVDVLAGRLLVDEPAG